MTARPFQEVNLIVLSNNENINDDDIDILVEPSRGEGCDGLKLPTLSLTLSLDSDVLGALAQALTEALAEALAEGKCDTHVSGDARLGH